MNKLESAVRVSRLPLALFLLALMGCSEGTHKADSLQTGSSEASPRAQQRPDGESRPRLVMLYAPCTVNTTFLSPYNGAVTYTPYLHALADRSTVFLKHRTEAGVSGVAYASIFTGTQAPGHGVFVHPRELSDHLYDISEAFADNGYETNWWNDHKMATKRLNYLQGVPEENARRGVILQNPAEFERLLQRLQQEPDIRAFVAITFTVTHSPYKRKDLAAFLRQFPELWSERYEDPPSGEEIDRLLQIYYKNYYDLQYGYETTVDRLGLSETEQRDLARVLELLYQLNINRLDRRFGRLMDIIERAGMMEDSLIAFTADHGETVHWDDSPFPWSHGNTVDSQVLNVPWIVFGPRYSVPASRANYVTRSIDVFPTLAELAGLKSPERLVFEGVDLSDVVRGQAPPPQLLAFSHSSMIPRYFDDATPEKIGLTRAQYYPRPDIALTWVAVRENDRVWKYGNFDANGFTFRAYNLADDPLELADRYNADDPKHQEMSEKLLEYHQTLIDAFQIWHGGGSAPTSEEDLEALRSLGYVQ